MSETIKSGDSGYIAKVDSNNRLFVDSKSTFAEEVAAYRENSYIWHGKCHLAAGTSGGLMSFTLNDPNFAYAITRMYFDAYTLTNDILIHQVKNPTPSGGTDVSLTNMINKNFTSGQTQFGTLKISDATSDITYTGGEDYHSFVIGSKEKIHRSMNGTNVLSNNNTIVFGWETLGGGTSGDGVDATHTDIISLSINGYRIPVEELD